jgi:opacity protein-like surface antigen
MSGSNARTPVGRLWNTTRAALYCGFGLMMASQIAAAAVTVSDSTFADANWNLTQFLGGTGGSVTAGQVLSGGNPGAFRNLTDTLTGGGVGIVLGTNIYTPFTYSPTVSGAIASLNYIEDAACTSGCFGAGQSTGPAVLQSGKLYILGTSTVITGPSAAWAAHPLNGLTALDFGLVNVTATTIVDNTQHPDFSATGAPIQVGYFRANGTGPGGGAYTLAAGIDNWQVTIVGAAPAVVAPVPTLGTLEITLLALAIGLLGLSFARRTR